MENTLPGEEAPEVNQMTTAVVAGAPANRIMRKKKKTMKIGMTKMMTKMNSAMSTTTITMMSTMTNMMMRRKMKIGMKMKMRKKKVTEGNADTHLLTVVHHKEGAEVEMMMIAADTAAEEVQIPAMEEADHQVAAVQVETADEDLRECLKEKEVRYLQEEAVLQAAAEAVQMEEEVQKTAEATVQNILQAEALQETVVLTKEVVKQADEAEVLQTADEPQITDLRMDGQGPQMVDQGDQPAVQVLLMEDQAVQVEDQVHLPADLQALQEADVRRQLRVVGPELQATDLVLHQEMVAPLQVQVPAAVVAHLHVAEVLQVQVKAKEDLLQCLQLNAVRSQQWADMLRMVAEEEVLHQVVVEAVQDLPAVDDNKYKIKQAAFSLFNFYSFKNGNRKF